ncbi:hypothetical protein LRR81_13730 [Metabacillus sp. GX 13764]|uniref:hypothetical protein n=1 Tax=Metabacillus kandeliae TaxID=2900151 RepID=UPI001E520365|nr:hypothetical protein [Metabacillus kandeliae]MCD7035303.1 hypothetical protein [Metabacillus kandeliae]
MTKTILKLTPFVFPLLAVICLLKGLAGKYTIQAGLCLLFIGFILSMYGIITNKSILFGLLNMALTVLLLIMGIFMYFVLVSS